MLAAPSPAWCGLADFLKPLERSSGSGLNATDQAGFLEREASFVRSFPADGVALRINKLYEEIPAGELPSFNASVLSSPGASPDFRVDALFHLKGRARFEPPLIAVAIHRDGHLPESELSDTAALYAGPDLPGQPQAPNVNATVNATANASAKATGNATSNASANATGTSPAPVPPAHVLAAFLNREDMSLRISLLQQYSPTERLRADHLIRFTANGYILISFICREEEYDLYQDTGRLALETLSLAPGMAYAAARPTKDQIAAEPLSESDWLWQAPLLALAVAAWAMVARLRRRKVPAGPALPPAPPPALPPPPPPALPPGQDNPR